ncbi:hypothetical protein CPC08DRAFT_771401 [Agrocybe pediades]|nr:hypothetical protein CPC08DRAFT_771401 [Agrocybe pediades]
MTHAQGAGDREVPAVQLWESAYRVFAGCPNLAMDLQLDAVLRVFQRGLQDQASIEVWYAALEASVAFLTACGSNQLALSVSLLLSMLETLPQLALANPTQTQIPQRSHLQVPLACDTDKAEL